MGDEKRLDSKDIIAIYHETGSIKLTAEKSGLTRQTVRRILITAGEYSTAFTELIREKQAQGQSIDSIAEELGVTRTWIIANMPYSRGAYSVGPRSENALYIAERRKRRKNTPAETAEGQKSETEEQEPSRS